MTLNEALALLIVVLIAGGVFALIVIAGGL